VELDREVILREKEREIGRTAQDKIATKML
jgi:hypothetical protein